MIYEATPGGGMRLVGADFLFFADAWNAKHPDPPELMGQVFHLFRGPNRFGLPAFYSLHARAWRDNPGCAAVGWRPNVSYASLRGRKPAIAR
jgi:hypothetical protein